MRKRRRKKRSKMPKEIIAEAMIVVEEKVKPAETVRTPIPEKIVEKNPKPSPSWWQLCCGRGRDKEKSLADELAKRANADVTEACTGTSSSEKKKKKKKRKRKKKRRSHKNASRRVKR